MKTKQNKHKIQAPFYYGGTLIVNDKYDESLLYEVPEDYYDEDTKVDMEIGDVLDMVEICDRFNLASGDMSPEDEIVLLSILKRFIVGNSQVNRRSKILDTIKKLSEANIEPRDLLNVVEPDFVDVLQCLSQHNEKLDVFAEVVERTFEKSPKKEFEDMGEYCDELWQKLGKDE